MRSRNIKPGFWENPELGEMPLAGRLLFAGLWCLADKEGRLEDRPKKIKGQLFRFDGDIPVDELLNNLQQRKFITRYTVSEQRYIQIINFQKHQSPHHTEKKSVIPPFNGEFTVNSPDKNGENPPDSLIHRFSDSPIPDSKPSAPTRKNGSKPEPKPEPDSPTFITIPTNKKDEEFVVTERLVAEFEELYPAVDVRQEFRGMRGWSLGKPEKRKTIRGMMGFINYWLSKAQNQGGNKRDGPNHSNGRLTKQGEKNASVMNEWLKKQQMGGSHEGH